MAETTWSDVALKMAQSANTTSAPMQWMYSISFLITSLMAAWAISNELDREAQAKADLELTKQRAEDLRKDAAIAAQVQEAQRLRDAALELDKEIAKTQADVAAQSKALQDRMDTLKKAKTWGDLNA